MARSTAGAMSLYLYSTEDDVVILVGQGFVLGIKTPLVVGDAGVGIIDIAAKLRTRL